MPARTPHFELLEPRLLLNADLIEPAPLSPPEAPLGGDAIYVDVSQQDGGTQEQPGVGPLFDIAVTGQAEMSLSAAFDGTNFLVGIQGDANAGYNTSAQLVGPDGSLIGDLISTGRTGGAPFVAFDGTNYLMVWTDDATWPNDDIYGQLINTSGTLVGPAFPISADAGEQDVEGVAFNGSNFLVVWRDGTYDALYGRFVSPSGSPVGSRISLGERSDRTAAAVVSDGQDFLVVWQRYASGGGDPHDIVGRIVHGDGSLESVFPISESSSPSYNPVSVAYNGSHYLVAWNHDTGAGYPNPTIWDVLGRCIGTDGSVLGGVLTLATGDGNQIVLPCGLASDGDGFLLTWITSSLGEVAGSDVYGQYLDSDGSPQGIAMLIAGGPGGQVGGGLSYGSGQYLCVMNDNCVILGEVGGDVVGRFITPESDDETPSPVYRFWSPVNSRHFYTIDETERDKLINLYSHVWTYEGPAYQAYADDAQAGVAPIYRFWSGTLNAHFYTMDQAERDKLINQYSHVWTYEGVAFYAYADGSQPVGTYAVYRFWSGTLNCHFFTMDPDERDKLINLYSHVWTYEQIAWYAFGS